MRTSTLSLILSACFVLLSIQLMGQSKYQVEGVVQDSLNEALVGATTMLMTPKDSVMVSFGITNANGQFQFTNIEEGPYRLQITYIGYGTYSQMVVIQGTSSTVDLGDIILSPDNELLEEVVIKSDRIPMQMKGDTLVYNADAFKTKPNATVEDLLKKMPGIEVERDGSIKAQGEDVQKVLVDGKEFFGSDTKIATQNLPADAVDKVEVFDKKSDEAEFTGIDDGEEQKTINLDLKEDKKNGMFGNVEGGYGIEDRFKGKLNVNKFGSDTQMSILGMANNINEQGFSFGEYMNFMGGAANVFGNGGGSFRFNSSNVGLPLNFDQSDGITDTYAGGVNFNKDFNDNNEIQSSYFYNNTDKTDLGEYTEETFTGDRNFESFGNAFQNQKNESHRVNLKYDLKIDTSSELTMNSSLSVGQDESQSGSEDEVHTASGTPVNTNNSSRNSSGDNQNLTTSLSYRKKLSKPGRNFLVRGNFGLNKSDSDGSIISTTNIFDNNGEFESAFEQNQEEFNINDQHSFGGRFSFTEPLAYNSFVELTLTHNQSHRDQTREILDLVENDFVINDNLSTQYDQTTRFNTIGAKWRYNLETVKMTFGLDYQRAELIGDILNQGVTIDNNFSYLLPNFRINWDPEGVWRINFNYRTNANEPSLTQLSPIIDRSNPTNIYIGNPDLVPEYSHSLRVRFMSFDQFSLRNIFATVSLGYSKNKIINQTFIDENFVRTQTPINVDNNKSIGGNVHFSNPLRFMGAKLNLNTDINYNDGIQFINLIENNVQRLNGSIGGSIENRNKDHLDIRMGYNFRFDDTRYSENERSNQNFISHNSFVDLTAYFPLDIVLETNFDYNTYQQQSFGDDVTEALWSASLSKSFMTNNRATLKLYVFDLLNQQTGLDRTNEATTIRQEYKNVLGRYYMLSFNYALSAFGPKPMDFKVSRRR